MNVSTKRVVVFLLSVLGVSIILNGFYPFIILGNSMKPTYHDKEVVICSKYFKSINLGDVVIIKKDDKTYIKRVVAVEGDDLKFDKKCLYVNGSHLCGIGINSLGSLPNKVPRGYVFCVGDNYNHSKDSRDKDFGFVNVKTEISGKVVS